MSAKKKPKQAEKRGRGRPTDYTPEIGERILERMSEGLSLAAAAAECDVHRQRVYEWERAHPEFADSIALARGKRQAFLERRMLGAKDNQTVHSSIFALKNAAPEDWREKVDVDANVAGEVKIIIGGNV